ncbi:phosphatase PAP2 family protein [Trinickia sp. EG282A]|uniref:phosphatase PAP2 family protein n=1 Tax=Trinickia sp. EG282A TaxID=3237013 RepID=UPI0034D353E7
MNGFDTAILTFLTQHEFDSAVLNHAIRVMAGLYTFKGFVLIPVLWWIWFQPGERREWQREMVIATIVSGLLSLLVGRTLAHYLPYRVRPIHNSELLLHFPPVNFPEPVLRFWNSFPSDHAMLWMSVATGIFLVWRTLGALVLLYTVVFICLPRVYLGLHYPTDVIGGAILGVAITYLMTRDAARKRYARPASIWFERSPAASYTLAFVVCFELITQFDEVVRLGESIENGLQTAAPTVHGISAQMEIRPVVHACRNSNLPLVANR